MPILANALDVPIEVDQPRYTQLIKGCRHIDVVDFDMRYYLYDVQDVYVPGLENCRLCLLTDGRDVLYSCYYNLVTHPQLGKRIVQVEVRCDVPGLARHMMGYYLEKYDTLRTEITHTPAGRNMWLRFMENAKYDFLMASLAIDATTEKGLNNQNSALPENFYNLRTADVTKAWHDNKQDVVVIYAIKESRP